MIKNIPFHNKTNVQSSLLWFRECIFFFLFSINISYAQNLNIEEKVFSIPKLKSIKIDGMGNDWTNIGTSCQLFSENAGTPASDKDLSAYFKIGWTDTAFCVFIEVKDDSIFYSKSAASDGVEFFLIDTINGKNKVQYILNPNIHNKKEPLSVVCWDHRGSRKIAGTEMTIYPKIKLTKKGYIIEASIPFKNIGVLPGKGKEIGFNIQVNDSDHENDKDRNALSWHYSLGTYINSFAFHRVVLDERTEIINYNVRSYILDRDTIFFIIDADKKYRGRQVLIKNGSQIFSRGVLKNKKIGCSFILRMPVKDLTRNYFSVYIDSLLIDVVDLGIVNMKYKNKEPLPHEDNVRFILKRNALNPPLPNPILFIGHSNFRYWHTFQEDMKDFSAINNAFGGSKTDQVLRYYDILVKPFDPKAIVYFEGANDKNAGVSPEKFIKNVKDFVSKAHVDFPEIKIYLVSPNMKCDIPSYDVLVKDFVKSNSDFVEYIDIECLKEKIDTDYDSILLPDKVHLNAKGYSILTPYFTEALKEYKK